MKHLTNTIIWLTSFYIDWFRSLLFEKKIIEIFNKNLAALNLKNSIISLCMWHKNLSCWVTIYSIYFIKYLFSEVTILVVELVRGWNKYRWDFRYSDNLNSTIGTSSIHSTPDVQNGVDEAQHNDASIVVIDVSMFVMVQLNSHIDWCC